MHKKTPKYVNKEKNNTNNKKYVVTRSLVDFFFMAIDKPELGSGYELG